MPLRCVKNCQLNWIPENVNSWTGNSVQFNFRFLSLRYFIFHHHILISHCKQAQTNRWWPISFKRTINCGWKNVHLSSSLRSICSFSFGNIFGFRFPNLQLTWPYISYQKDELSIISNRLQSTSNCNQRSNKSILLRTFIRCWTLKPQKQLIQFCCSQRYTIQYAVHRKNWICKMYAMRM